VEDLVAMELAALADKQVGQAAVIVVDNPTGEILAYVGSKDFFDVDGQGQNDGVQAARQPGSALKPFAYGLALSDGLTPATVLSDLEVHLDTPSGDYTPKNYDRRLHGPVRLRSALQNSYNVPAVRLADQLHPGRVLQVLRKAGMSALTEEPEHYGVGVVLGNGDVPLYQLARAYRGLARGGVVGPLTPVRRAWDVHGQPLRVTSELTSRRFLDAESTALLTDILTDESSRTPAFGVNNSLRFPFPVAAKTGTSRAYVDNWTVGFTAERTVGVWVGNFDGRPMRGVSGITGAGPIFRRVMLRAMRDIHPAPMVRKSQFRTFEVCSVSGQRSGPACPGTVQERFLPGSEPGRSCSMHRTVTVDRRTGRPVAPASPHAVERTVLDMGPEYYAWAQGEGIDAGPWPEPEGDGRARAGRFLSPRDGDEYMIEPGIPVEDQTIPVRVLAPKGVQRVVVRGAGGERMELQAPFAGRVPARRGEQQLEMYVPGESKPVAIARFRVH
jgi:penicillin-binding protein 1C